MIIYRALVYRALPNIYIYTYILYYCIYYLYRAGHMVFDFYNLTNMMAFRGPPSGLRAVHSP